MEILVKYGKFILLFIWVQGVFAQQVRVESPVRFLALGDSYTIGQSVPAEDRWPVQLAERLKNLGVEMEELKIIAQTGWRTDNLLDAIEKEKPDSNYNLVSLLIGVNNQYQGRNIAVYPLEFRQLLNKAIEFCGGNKAGVFVLSIPDYGYTPFGASNREITIFNGLGVEVYHAETEFTNSFSINVSGWEPGIYFYRIKNAGQVVSRGKVLVNNLGEI